MMSLETRKGYKKKTWTTYFVYVLFWYLPNTLNHIYE